MGYLSRVLTLLVLICNVMLVNTGPRKKKHVTLREHDNG